MNNSENKEHRPNISDSIRHIQSLSMEEKLSLTDTIFEKQPKLLLEVVGLSKANIPPEKIEHLLFLLMVFYDYFHDQRKTSLPEASYKMVDDAYKNNQSMIKLMDKEEPSLMMKGAMAYPEIEALTFMCGYLNEKGFTSESVENEHCTNTAKMVLDVFAKLKTGK